MFVMGDGFKLGGLTPKLVNKSACLSSMVLEGLMADITDDLAIKFVKTKRVWLATPF